MTFHLKKFEAGRFLGAYSNKYGMLPMAGKQTPPKFLFTLAGIVYFLVFVTVLAGKKPSNFIAGGNVYFLKVLACLITVKSTLLAFTAF